MLYVYIHYKSAYTVVVHLKPVFKKMMHLRTQVSFRLHCSLLSCRRHRDHFQADFFFSSPSAQIATSQQSGKLGCTQLFGQTLLRCAMSTWLFYCSSMVPGPNLHSKMPDLFDICQTPCRPSVPNRTPTREKIAEMRQGAVATYFWLQTCSILSTRLDFYC